VAPLGNCSEHDICTPHEKEHIANIEQIVYSAVLALPGRGRFVAGLPNPGHKEHGS
jgi:hypothetical protein